jgi:acetate kinase
VAAKEELGPSELNALLNKHSGLIGVSGLSNDMRKLLEAEAAGNERARLAVDVFCYRLRKYVAAYVGVLGGADAVVFTGGIGENAPAVRARSVAGLDAMGIAVDPARNEDARGREADVSAEGSRCRVLVIPTNEELLIARDAYRIVEGLPLA